MRVRWHGGRQRERHRNITLEIKSMPWWPEVGDFKEPGGQYKCLILDFFSLHRLSGNKTFSRRHSSSHCSSVENALKSIQNRTGVF